MLSFQFSFLPPLMSQSQKGNYFSVRDWLWVYWFVSHPAVEEDGGNVQSPECSLTLPLDTGLIRHHWDSFILQTYCKKRFVVVACWTADLPFCAVVSSVQLVFPSVYQIPRLQMWTVPQGLVLGTQRYREERVVFFIQSRTLSLSLFNGVDKELI